jgi:hypothetical protein
MELRLPHQRGVLLEGLVPFRGVCPTELLLHKCVKWFAYLFTYLLTYLFTYSLTHSMQHSPSWEANRFSAIQEIRRILRNSIHSCLPPVTILSQLDPVHAPTSYFLKIYLNIILPSMPGFYKWSISLRFPHQNPVYASLLPHTRYMPRYLILLGLITQTIVGEQYR